MRLKSISNDEGQFILLDLDKPWQLAEAVGLKAESASYLDQLTTLTKQAAKTLTKSVTGVVFGPKVGYLALADKHKDVGLVLSLDNNLEPHDPLGLPRFLPDWGVEHIRNNYGLIKLTLFYNPKEELALKKKELLAEVYDYASYEGTKLVLELKITPYGKLKTKQEQEAFLETQLQAARELQKLVDLLVLDFPLTPLACATLTAELDVPWLLNDQAVEYRQLKENLRVALEGGASGMLIQTTFLDQAPRLTAAKLDDKFLSLWQRFLATEARDRVLELSRIIKETNLIEI